MSERTNGSSLAFAHIYALGLLAIATYITHFFSGNATTDMFLALILLSPLGLFLLFSAVQVIRGEIHRRVEALVSTLGVALSDD
jgi:hypothetical protein